MKTPCPDPDDVELLVAGKLSKEVSQELESHLLTCEHCLQLAESSIAADEINTLFAVGETSQIIPNDAPLLSSLIEHGAKLLSDKQPDSDEQTWLGQEVEDTNLSRQQKKQLQLHEEATSFLLPPEEEDELGRLGGYRILEILGSGGMGVVFRAEDPRLKRQVALKAMKSAIATDQEAKLRFLREAEATAAIEHDNIVTIYQVGEENGVPFIAMQLLKGESLKSRMSRQGRLSQEETIRIGSQIAAGLQAAHERGLIHRDIKPDNIWLQEGTDRVRIVDFGLVRNNADDVELTTSGVVLGTPRYMSPEQAQGQAVDHRCDLFSLGSVLYRLVSGQDAFSGNVVTAVLVAVASGEPAPLRELFPEIDPDLDLIIQTLLKKNPDERYSTAADVEVRLNRIQSGSTRPPDSKPETLLAEKRNPPKSRILLTGAAFFGVILLAGIIITLINKDGSRTTIRTDDDTRIEITSDDGGAATERKNTGGQTDLGGANTPPPIKVSNRTNLAMVFPEGTPGGDVYLDPLPWSSDQELTIECWIDSTHSGRIFRLVEKDVYTFMNIWLEKSEHQAEVFYKGTNRFAHGAGTMPANLPKRVHLAFTLKNRLWQLWLNGKQLAEMKEPKDDNGKNFRETGALLAFFAYYDEEKQVFKEQYTGPIDEIRISNVSRYSGSNYQIPAELFEPDEHTIAIYHCDEGQGNQLTDSSGNNNHAIIRGTPKWVPVKSNYVMTNGKEEKQAPPTTIQSSAWHGWPSDAPKPAIAPFDADQAKAHQEAWARYLGVPVEYTNSIGMKFRLIPPGEFLMGATPEEIESALVAADKDQSSKTQANNPGPQIDRSGPQHKVILTQPIYIGVSEVTQLQYETIIGANPSHFSATGKGQDAVTGLDTDNHPVEMVSWNDATEFCAKLSLLEKYMPFYFRAGEEVTPLNGTGYRLPTEAEWEYSCRAGTTTRFWCGDDENDVTQVGWIDSNSGRRTHAVGELRPNSFGLWDMHGSIWELVQDNWDPTFYARIDNAPSVDPYNPFHGNSFRVIRGGFWATNPSLCRSSLRAVQYPSARSMYFGFRVVLTVDTVRQLLKTPIARTEPQRTKAGPEDPQRRAAEMVIERGGWVGIHTLSSLSFTSKFEELPQERFAIGEVGLRSNTQLTDADIQILGDIYSGRTITILHGSQNLSGSAIKSIASTGLLDYTHSEFTMTDEALALFAEKAQPYSLNIPSMPANPLIEQSLAHMSSLRRLQWGLYGAESGVTADGLKGLAKLPGLYHLYLLGHGLTGEHVALLAASENLRSLSIPLNPLTDEDIPHLSSLKRLSQLELTSTKLTKDGVSRLRELLPNTDIIHPELLAEDDQRRIVQWVLSEGGVVDEWKSGSVKSPPVKSFSATNIRFEDPGKSPDGGEANKLAGLNALQSLRWDFLKNADIAMETIGTLDSLVQLEINGSDISTAGMKHVGELKQIELLFLNSCKSLDDGGVSQLKDLKHIYHLQLSVTPISSSGLLHLGQIPSLQMLYLRECRGISDDGIQHLVSLSRLRYLDLSGTPLTDACIPHLSQMQSLRILFIDYTKITAEGAAKLQAALPKCVVFHESLKDTPWQLPEPEVPAEATAPFSPIQAKAHQEAWARYFGVPVEHENSFGMKFRLIPPGEFVMGSPESENGGGSNDEAQIKTAITQAFQMATTEVTQQAWQRVMGTEPWIEDTNIIQGNDYPITKISWQDALDFCQKITTRERELGLIPADWHYRLPTEAEWEYACRAGSQTAFSFGNDVSQLNDYAWFGAVSGGSAKGESYPHLVAAKKPNPWGLYDVHGNVFEWCLDAYQPKLPGGKDPLVELDGVNRVFRSGGYDDPASYCRSADRFNHTPGDKRSYLGFRIVLSQIPSTPVTDKPHEGTP